MKNYIIIILCLLIFFLLYINNENFDESKIKTREFAENKIMEFNYEYYKSYIDKYFKKVNIKNLKKITINNDNKILCSIASYRDKECPLTVKDMIDKAKYPENLVICICQQNDPNDVSCLDNYDLKGAIIKKISLTDHDARGPCWARFLIQQEWTGEQYFLQIDSHMRFEQDWDFHCINDIKHLPEKSCLTNYPPNYNLETGITDPVNKLRGPLKIDNKETSEYDGFFRVNSEFIISTDKPILSYGWGACFSFSNSKILYDAPYDPYTPHLFFGEEMDILARLITNGWMVYSPTHSICFTSFDRNYRPTFWSNPDQEPCEFLSRLRLYYKFRYLNDIPNELKTDLDKYDLGNFCTYQEFLTFCLNELTIEEFHNLINKNKK
jgi:[Skp1-protein]-hydroxyproline N-acetylglucosaminyltransferase